MKGTEMETLFLLKKGTESEIAKQIREFIGANDFEEIEVQTPQFIRTDGRQPFYFPHTIKEFEKLKECPHELLVEMCCEIWNIENGIEHWLYPGEWYGYIPKGYPVLDINDDVELFQRGKTDDDIRFGCLSYGFKKPI